MERDTLLTRLLLKLSVRFDFPYLICYINNHLEVLDMEIKTDIVRIDNNSLGSEVQDYSSSFDHCSLRLTCTAPKKTRIDSGSCSFT